MAGAIRLILQEIGIQFVQVHELYWQVWLPGLPSVSQDLVVPPQQANPSSQSPSPSLSCPSQTSHPSSTRPSQSSSRPLQVSAGGTQVPQLQPSELQVWVPVELHEVVQLRVAPGVQVVEHPLHGPHAQVEPQVRDSVPPHEQLRVSTAPGEQTPLPVHAPHAPHIQLALQVRVWVPQLPQGWDSVAPGLQTPTPVQLLHTPHVQLALQVRV